MADALAACWEQHTFDDCLWHGKRFTCEYTNATDPAMHEGKTASPPRCPLLGVAGEHDKIESRGQFSVGAAVHEEHALTAYQCLSDMTPYDMSLAWPTG